MAGFKVLPLQAQLEPIQIPGKFDFSNRTELTQPGFRIRVHQANEDLLNTESERESVLSGKRPDFLGFPLENFARETGAQKVDWILGHTFLAEGSIDLEQGGNTAGEVNEEQIIPGIPGFEDKHTFLTTEILMLLQIPNQEPINSVSMPAVDSPLQPATSMIWKTSFESQNSKVIRKQAPHDSI